MAGFPVLETRRLMLREFRPSDVQAVFDIFSRDVVTRYHNLETMQSLEPAEKIVEMRASMFGKGWGIRWGIVLKAQTDTVIGSCGYYNLNSGYHSAEIGYDLHPDYWRRGIMTEALAAAIAYGFGDGFFFHLNRIEAVTYPEHTASTALLRKLGFQEEGIRREGGYWKNQYHDLRVFSLLRRDWEISLAGEKIGHLSNRKTRQVSDAPGGFLLYYE